MPVPIPSSSPPPERVMSKQLRGLVDNCLDEGQYQAAVSTLDHIRSARYRPSQTHLRQLLYLALYPPTPSSKAASDGRRLSQPLGSPSKITTREPVPVPKPEDSISALNLLHAFRLTNSAAACALALPVLWERRSRDEESDEEEEDESRFARSARCIGAARSVWELLKPGAVKRLGEVDKPRDDDDDDDEGQGEEGAGESKLTVADHAVPVLEWMIALWEDDARTNPEHYSKLLLSQLPPSPTSSMRVMDANAPLNVVAYLLQPVPPTRADGEPWPISQEAETLHRAQLASRLLQLLIACTTPSPPALSPTNLLRQTSYILPSLPPSSLQALLTTPHARTHPQPTQSGAYSRFKVALCALFLAHTSRDASSEGLLGSSPVKKPAATAGGAVPVGRRARALRGRGKEPSSGGASEGPAASTNAEGGGGEKLYPLASPKIILPLFSLEPKPTTSGKPASSRVRTPPPSRSNRPSGPSSRASAPTSQVSEEARERHKIAKLSILQSLSELDVRRLPEWKDVVRDGELREAVECWSGGEGRVVGAVVRGFVKGIEGG